MITSYPLLSLEAQTYTFWKTLGSLYCTTKTVLPLKGLTIGVDDARLHPLPTNLGQELQPLLRSLVCSFRTTQLRKDALHVDWQHLRSLLHKSVRFTT